MYTQNKKIFHIIGSNPINFFDMTLEGLENSTKIRCSYIIKIFSQKFYYFFKRK